jgi:hypothetical protein
VTRAAHALLAVVAVVAVAACGPKPIARGADADDAVIYIESNVKDAGVWVDGVFIGGVDTIRGGIAIDPGDHRLEVRHDEYYAHYAVLKLTTREKRNVVVELAPVLP